MVAHEVAQRANGGLRFSRLHERKTKAVARVDRGGIERGRGFQVRDGAFEIAPLPKSDAELQVRNREPRGEGDGLPKLPCRARHVPLLTEHEPEVIARVRVVGPQPHGGLERRARAVDVAGPPARRAEMVLRIEQRGVERDRAGKMRERGIGLAQLPAHVSEPIVRLGQLGAPLERAFVRVGGAGEILRAFPGLTDEEERLCGVRVVCGRPALLRGPGDAQRAGEEHPCCTRRTAEHARILAVRAMTFAARGSRLAARGIRVGIRDPGCGMRMRDAGCGMRDAGIGRLGIPDSRLWD